MRAEKVEYFQSINNGKWYFHKKARNGRITDASQGYANKRNCLRAIRRRWPDIAVEMVAP